MPDAAFEPFFCELEDILTLGNYQEMGSGMTNGSFSDCHCNVYAVV